LDLFNFFFLLFYWDGFGQYGGVLRLWENQLAKHYEDEKHHNDMKYYDDLD
jgi:hypothetical protein